MIRRITLILVVAFMVAAVPAAAAETANRIVAIGDVHGSLEGLTTILRETELIDEQGHWAGGDTSLIQTGDLFDRGVEVHAVMDLLMRLQVEAPRSGGEVICLLGNHEAMNILGVVRDVNPEVFAVFADDSSNRRLGDAFAAMKSCWRRRSKLLGHQMMDTGRDAKEQWLDSFPAGKLEYLASLGPNARYGAWLRSLPMAVVRNNTLFVHGGLAPELRGVEHSEMNRRAADEIHRFDTYRNTLHKHGLILETASISEVVMVGSGVIQAAGAAEGSKLRALQPIARELSGLAEVENWSVVRSDGPLWFRGCALWDEDVRGAEMVELIDSVGVERMVIGHTVQPGGQITSRFGGRVVAIDTGMLSEVYKGGGPSALELDDGWIVAVYPGQRYELVDGDWTELRAP